VPPGLVVVVVVELDDEELQADSSAAPARPTARIATCRRLRCVRVNVELVTDVLPFGFGGFASVAATGSGGSAVLSERTEVS
jgi:hypothetical protein